jgi:hypothetical protein
MEFLEGETLKHRSSGQPLETDEILEFGIQIADGLNALNHSHGNLRLTGEGGRRMVSRRDKVEIGDSGFYAEP